MLQIDQDFNGRVHLASSIGPGASEGTDEAMTLVIRDAAGLKDFVGSIPKKRIQKRQPAPPSKDPLLNDPQIDFTTHSLVVIKRASMYVGPEIERVEARGSGARVLYRLPPLGDTIHAAAVIDMGSYTAALVPRIEGEVAFEVLPNPSEGEAPAQAR